jgi:AAA domain-containing protein
MLFGRPPINSVFTPRGSFVNRGMYIDRPELERELARALAGALHAIIYGESGNGKSWLYKKVIADLDWCTFVANCANAPRVGSLTQEIADVATPAGTPSLRSYSESKGAEVGAELGINVGGQLKHQKEYQVRESEPLLGAFKNIRAAAGDQPAVLVLDNLEAIFDSRKLMEELGNIVTLLDDARYAQYRVKILIVGVPSGVIEYFSRAPNLRTVANRLQEISEVRGLTEPQCNALTRRGLVDQLRIKLEPFDLQEWQEHIFAVTLGIPQRVHEYCEQLAYLAEEQEWKGSLRQLDLADQAWLRIGLRESYSAIETLMNERETKAGRRNQVLYALGRMPSRTFISARVEDVLRSHFPRSTDGIALAIGQIMAELEKAEGGIIRRTPKGDAFYFSDPRYAMAIRTMLKIDAEEKVYKIEL